MIFSTKTRLSVKIFTILFISAVAVFTTVGLATFSIVRDLTINSQKEKASLLIDSVKPGITLSLYLGIKDFGSKLLTITDLPEVIGLRISDQHGEIVLDYSKFTSKEPYESIEITKTLTEPSSSKAIGSVTLIYSGEEFNNTMERFYTLYSWVLLTVFTLLMAVLVLMNRLLRPIERIAETVMNYTPGEKVSFNIPDAQQEFNQIIHAFESMQERVCDYASEIQTINKNLEEKVSEQTHAIIHNLYYDNLTRLPNRLKLQKDLAELPHSTVAILNIDDFKEINDFFGIDLGDWLLKQIAQWFSEMNLHPYRIGGDEFAFMMKKGTSHDIFCHEMEKLLSLLSEKNFSIADETVHVRATIGIAIDSDKPLIHADVALNKARQQHIHSSIYDQSEGIEQQYQANIAMSAHIRQALLEHRIICQYQPIVCCKTGNIEKYETLVRIINEDGSLIGPYQFLSIAQKTKLYHHITQEVVYQSCHLFAKRSESFSINLSSTDILDSRTVNAIESILKETETAHRVIFEILESEGFENFDEISRFISRMQGLGAKIAIDDFGTGYSNYGHILKLNVDIIKIDGSLIKMISDDSRHRKVVEAIVDFADRLGIETVAEFVASEEILQNVKDIGITYAQGFHTGKPGFLDRTY